MRVALGNPELSAKEGRLCEYFSLRALAHYVMHSPSKMAAPSVSIVVCHMVVTVLGVIEYVKGLLGYILIYCVCIRHSCKCQAFLLSGCYQTTM